MVTQRDEEAQFVAGEMEHTSVQDGEALLGANLERPSMKGFLEREFHGGQTFSRLPGMPVTDRSTSCEDLENEPLSDRAAD